MPREVRTQVDVREVMNPISRPQATQVVARPVSQLELQAPDPELMGLIQGLSDLSPKLQQYAYASRFSRQKEEATHMQQGAADAAQGKELKPGSPEYYQHGYMVQRGQVGADEAGQAYKDFIHTEFDWDTGDIHQATKEFFAKDTHGITDKSYLEGYNSSILKHIEQVQGAVQEYRGKAVIERTETDAMYRLQKSLTSLLATDEFGNRPDGTPKGNGFLGVLKGNKGQAMTEYSVGVNIGGKNMDIPTLVPGLTPEELNYIKDEGSLERGNPVADSIVAKAVEHAKSRLAAGKSPFASNAESPTTLGVIESYRKELKDTFGISNSRFNDLLFTSLKSIGDEGNPEVYDVLKANRPDGTPGMYSIPIWKPKIDAGIIHATNTSLAKSREARQVNKDAREETQGKAVMPLLLLADTDKESALTQLTSLAKSGLISDPKDYHAFVNMIHSVGNKAERADAQMAETDAFVGVYRGTENPKTIMANPKLTPQQQRNLIGSFYQLQSQKRMEASQGQQEKYAVLKSPRYKEAEDYVESNLKVISNMFDFDKSGVEYSSGQLALAKRELFNAALVAKSPEELEAKSFSIVTDYQDRARKYADIKNKADAKRIRFSTPEALGAAFASGKVSREEAELHMNFFESQLRKVTANAAR